MDDAGQWGGEKLSKLNHENWFRLMSANFECKGVSHVLEKTLIEFARVAVTDPTAFKNSDLEQVDNPSPRSENTHIYLNIDKKAMYLKDVGTVKVLLLSALR